MSIKIMNSKEIKEVCQSAAQQHKKCKLFVKNKRVFLIGPTRGYSPDGLFVAELLNGTQSYRVSGYISVYGSFSSTFSPTSCIFKSERQIMQVLKSIYFLQTKKSSSS